MYGCWEATPEDIAEIYRKKERGELVSIDSPEGRAAILKMCADLGIDIESEDDTCQD